MTAYEDPGWGAALGKWLGMHVPIPLPHTPDSTDGITSIRVTFIAFLEAPVVASAIYLFVTALDGRLVPGRLRLEVAVYGLASVAGVLWARERPLVASSPEILAASYRWNFFLGVAVAESPALLGFVVTLIQGEISSLLIGLVFTGLGLNLLAPTRANIERGQRTVEVVGSPLSLGRSLLEPTPKGAEARQIARELRNQRRR